MKGTAQCHESREESLLIAFTNTLAELSFGSTAKTIIWVRSRDPMIKTHKTAIVAIPPKDVREPIQAIRRLHDRKIRRWMPHVTLIYPFYVESEFEAVASELTPACRNLRPIEVTLTTFQTFGHGKGHFTVWLKPEPTEPLLDLHAASKRQQ